MKNKILQIRVSEAELKALKALAAINCTTVTGLIVTKLLAVPDHTVPVITPPKIPEAGIPATEKKAIKPRPFKSRLKGEWKP